MTPEMVLQKVAELYGEDPGELRRMKTTAPRWPQRVAMVMMRRTCNATLKQVGEVFGCSLEPVLSSQERFLFCEKFKRGQMFSRQLAKYIRDEGPKPRTLLHEPIREDMPPELSGLVTEWFDAEERFPTEWGIMSGKDWATTECDRMNMVRERRMLQDNTRKRHKCIATNILKAIRWRDYVAITRDSQSTINAAGCNEIH